MKYKKDLQFTDLSGREHTFANTLKNIKLIEEFFKLPLYEAFREIRALKISITKQCELIRKLTGISEDELEKYIVAKGANDLQMKVMGLISVMISGEEFMEKAEKEADEEAAKAAETAPETPEVGK